MALPTPSMAQGAALAAVVSAGGLWFGVYAGMFGAKKSNLALASKTEITTFKPTPPPITPKSTYKPKIKRSINIQG